MRSGRTCVLERPGHGSCANRGDGLFGWAVAVADVKPVAARLRTALGAARGTAVRARQRRGARRPGGDRPHGRGARADRRSRASRGDRPCARPDARTGRVPPPRGRAAGGRARRARRRRPRARAAARGRDHRAQPHQRGHAGRRRATGAEGDERIAWREPGRASAAGDGRARRPGGRAGHRRGGGRRGRGRADRRWADRRGELLAALRSRPRRSSTSTGSTTRSGCSTRRSTTLATAAPCPAWRLRPPFARTPR
jgi:hypothetical protein